MAVDEMAVDRVEVDEIEVNGIAERIDGAVESAEAITGILVDGAAEETTKEVVEAEVLDENTEWTLVDV